MAGIKVYVRDDVEEKFRRLSMMVYGYGRGSISKAAEEALLWWMMRHEAMLKESSIPEDPVGAIRGLLAGVGRNGIELQHEARRIRTVKAAAKALLKTLSSEFPAFYANIQKTLPKKPWQQDQS